MTQSTSYPLADGIAEFITAGESFAGGVDLSISAQRQAYNAACRFFAEPKPQGLQTADKLVPLAGREIQMRIYTPFSFAPSPRGAPSVSSFPISSNCVVYFHGGGFVVGDLESHDSFLNRLCLTTGLRIVSVDYRLAPEHPFPAALDDCYDITQQIKNHALIGPVDQVIVAGDSAGGNLAAAVCLRAQTNKLLHIHGQLLIYPGLAKSPSMPSHDEHRDAPGLTTADINYYAKLYAGSEHIPTDNPEFAPLSAKSVAGLPPAFVITAQIDPLRDEGLAWSQRLTAEGVLCSYVEAPGLIHGFIRAARYSQAADDAITAICDGLKHLIHA